ncbi:GGDEF domain-containing protein [Pseudomonas sp. dw_358]|uniref:GGDEF domain-containing protein n=1 Tax=Pseudomonas sp. dw_358 TaxID=2720083 RepID=UPI001BD2B121|nr:GGDEF domain-containing protein [Pseudomonas sp. dw_358]
MSEDAERWKEKYLKSLEQQEKLERRWNARVDLLRRGLVRSTLAAEGNDSAVDQCMKEMREVVRTDEMDAKLMTLLPRLEKAVLDSEQRRETRVSQIGTALNALVVQLQGLPLPREVRGPLKKFAKHVEERSAQVREIPLLLTELSALQSKALSVAEKPQQGARPGLLQRLFGTSDEPVAGQSGQGEVGQPTPLAADSAGRYDSPEDEAEAEPAVPAAADKTVEPAGPVVDEAPVVKEVVHAPVEADVPVREAATPAQTDVEVASPAGPAGPLETAKAPDSGPAPAAVEPEPVAEADAELSPAVTVIAPVLRPGSPARVFLDSLPLPAVMAEAIAAIDPEEPEQDVLYALPESPEPSYSSVASHIEETLLGLLDNLSLPERHQPQADSMRLRLEHGLNWYELLPILDDLAVLTLAINDSGQHEFETYLQQLNERLDSFQGNLQAASEGHADNRSAARELDTQLREQVGGLQSSMEGATDVDSLKKVLENRLEDLLGTMDKHQQQRDQREQEIAAQLHGLSERVISMEREAQDYREHLEEQRQKALIDPLTGLPNRAAWSERLEAEIASQEAHDKGLLVGILDLDHFKTINDSYGHLAGDKVLKIIATQLRKRLRPEDFIARFGGEEFVLLMPATQLAEGAAWLEGLRATVAACPFHFKGQRVSITASMGVTAFKVGENSDMVLKRADQALYRAKDNGRNRIEAG